MQVIQDFQHIKAEKKKRVQSAYLNIEQTTKRTGYFIETPANNEFCQFRLPQQLQSHTVPNVFQLNTQQHHQLMNTMQHIQPNKRPFDLNFEIPRISENTMGFLDFSKETPLAVSIIPIQSDIQSTHIVKQLQFSELVMQESHYSKAKYWEDLSAICETRELVEITPIHIRSKQNIMSILQHKGLRIMNQYTYVRIIQQMLLGFQNEYFIFDIPTSRYIQLQTTYVEDITCLDQISEYFMQLGTNIQILKFHLLKQPNNKILLKVNQVVQQFLDEYQSKLLQLIILQPNMTLIEFQLQCRPIHSQVIQLVDIFTKGEQLTIQNTLYESLTSVNFNSQYLSAAFVELLNFQLLDFQGALNLYDIEIQVPSFFPHQFSSTYAQSIQGLALITQAKDSKLMFIDELIQLCQINHLQLINDIQAKSQYIIAVYKQKQLQLNHLKLQYDSHMKSQAKDKQQKKLAQVRAIQDKYNKQRQQEQHLKQVHQENQREAHRQLVLQIEVNRINKKYERLLRQQDERDQLLEDELKQKQAINDEKQQLLRELSQLQGQQQIIENIGNKQQIDQDDGQQIQEEIQQQPQLQQIQQTQNINIINDNSDAISVEVEQPKQDIIQQNTMVIQELLHPIQNKDCQLVPLQLQLMICVGMHGKYHNTLINSTIKFILFQQLNYMNIWQNIKKYYFTEQGDFVDAYIFELIDVNHFITPSRLVSYEVTPKLRVASVIGYSKQEFYQCKLSDCLQLYIDSKTQLLQACFPSGVASKIMMIFDFMLKLRYSAYNLRNKWKQINSILNDQDRRTRNQLSQLRHQMQTFVDLYQNYIYYDVIESTWGLFIDSLNKAESLDQLVGLSDKYLGKILESALIVSDKKSIKDSLQQCLLMINQFIQLIDMQSNRGLIQYVNLDISQLIINFTKQSEFFQKFIKWLKDYQQFDKPY